MPLTDTETTATDPASATASGPDPSPGPTATATRPRARGDLGSEPVERLEAEVIDLSARLAAGTYELLVLVGELDHRGSWATWGALSCAAWLADVSEIDVATARTQVRVARAMRQFPALDRAMASGDVSYAKARVLAAYLTPANVEDLLAIAATTPAGRLGAAIAAWSQRNDDPDAIRRRQHQARSVSWRTEPDGMVALTARLTPETAGSVCAAIDTVVTRTHAPTGAPLTHQRADALVSLITDGGGSVTAEVVVHVSADGNTLTDGTPLSDHAVASLLPEAFVSLLLHDNEGQPIDASPRRRLPRRQRRVLDQIDPECRQPGCHATAFLQCDHIEPYAKGGPTVLANLQRLCGPHNRARTDSTRPPDRAR